ncbi:LysE family transporter, partial [Escherichia coli]|uniref:LysE family transporter n=1 Tax=Escherichia coli TaxID=562 RepID=UPI00207BA911
GIFALIIVETLAWFTVVASLFALPQMRRGYQRLAKWIDGFAGIDPMAMSLLTAWSWPGNIRELSNVIERAVVMNSGPIIFSEDL